MRKGRERMLLRGLANGILRPPWLAGLRRRSGRSRRHARGGLQSSGSAMKRAGEPHGWSSMAETVSRMATLPQS